MRELRLAPLGATMVCAAVLATSAGAQAGELERQMRHAVNKARAQHGLSPLHGSRSLRRSAGGYARWMLRAGYFGHLGQIRASSRFSLVGENLAWHSGGRPRVARTVRGWMHSAPHRALILHPGFRWLGAGIARGRLHGRRATAWVLHFGGPLRPATAKARGEPAAPALPDQLLSEDSVRAASPEIAATTSAAGASRASAAP